MKRRKTERWGLLALACLCAVLFTAAAWADETEPSRVYDQARLFSGEQIQELEDRASQAAKKTHMDLVVATTGDTRGMDSRKYADTFFLEGGFGAGKKKNGALFLIDMDNREIYISTSGDMIRFLTDQRIEAILDQAYEKVGVQDYKGAADLFLSETAAYYQKGIESGQYNYDEKTGKISRHRSVRWYEALIALAAAGVSGAVPCAKVKREYAMEQERRQAVNYHMAYRAAAAFTFDNQSDELVNKFVTQMLIPRNRGSNMGGRPGDGARPGRSTTHSTGGHTFGGGGRKF